MTPFPTALDLTDAEAVWCSEDFAHPLSSKIPCVLLPLYEGEPPITGVAAEYHRRGSALLWPPECQVPVAGNPKRGTGRIPIAALWAKLIAAEKAGVLDDHSPFAWEPFVGARISVSTPDLLVAALTSWGSCPSAIVVPDSLGPAGQQAILDRLPTTPHLIPASIAAALAWCRTTPLPKKWADAAAEGDGTPVGHLLVVHAGLGLWEATRVAIVAIRHGTSVFLSPVFARKNRIALPQFFGAALLAQKTAFRDALFASWTTVSERVQGVHLETQDASDFTLVPNLKPDCTLNEVLTLVREEIRNGDSNRIGLLVHGTWAKTATDGLSVQPLPCPPHAAALGAYLAESAATKKLPFWKEELDPLDFHCIGSNELGDPCSEWQPLVASATVDAWAEFHPKPIRGLEIPPGAKELQLTIRSPHGNDFAYRKVKATLDEPQPKEEPIELDIRINPGQGFARIEVTSLRPGLFHSRLEWEKMEPCKKPAPPKFGYIPGKVTLKADAGLWNEAVPDLQHFVNTPRGSARLETAIKSARNRLNRWPKAADLDRLRGIPNQKEDPDIYLFYSAIGSDGKLPGGQTPPARDLWMRVCDHALNCLSGRVPLPTTTQAAIRRMLAWSYSACPPLVVELAVDALKNGTTRAIDLRTAGHCFKTPPQLKLFWAAVIRSLPSTSTPNEWLIAIRNISRLNEHALSDEILDDADAKAIVTLVHAQFESAIRLSKSTTAGNAMESLLFLLKRRRYQKDFLDMTDLVRQSLERRLKHTIPSLSKRHDDMREKLLLLLRSEANETDIATLIVSDSEDDDGN